MRKAKDQRGNEIDLPDVPEPTVEERFFAPKKRTKGMAQEAYDELKDSEYIDQSAVRSWMVDPPYRKVTEEMIDELREKCPRCGQRTMIVEGKDEYCPDCGYHNFEHAGTPTMYKAWEEYIMKKQGPMGALAGEAVKQIGQTAQAPFKAMADTLRHAGEVAQGGQQQKGPASNIIGGAGNIALGTGQLASSAYKKYKAQQDAIKQQAQPKAPAPIAGQAANTTPPKETVQSGKMTIQDPNATIPGQKYRVVDVPLVTAQAAQMKQQIAPTPSAKEKAENLNTAANIVQKPNFGKS